MFSSFLILLIDKQLLWNNHIISNHNFLNPRTKQNNFPSKPPPLFFSLFFLFSLYPNLVAHIFAINRKGCLSRDSCYIAWSLFTLLPILLHLPFAPFFFLFASPTLSLTHLFFFYIYFFYLYPRYGLIRFYYFLALTFR